MRFEKRSDHYFDTKTGLEWSIVNHGPLSWQEAIVDCGCKSLESGTYLQGDFYQFNNGWRLPTIEELLTLVNYEKYNPATDLLDMLSSGYWSSTTHADDTDDAWVVDFNGGDDYWSDKANYYYVRAVRG